LTDEISRLEIQFRTSFLLDDAGRLVETNAPDRTSPPKFAIFGCDKANRAGVGADVPPDLADRLIELAGNEPPLAKAGQAPRQLAAYLDTFARRGSTPLPRFGVTHVLPHRLEHQHAKRLIQSDTPEGRGLVARLDREGMPSGLRDMGFVDASEFWAPWCAAMHGDEVAAIAFAARLSPTGASLGLATAPHLRNQGYGSAATAGWTQNRRLGARLLFYSTDLGNLASQALIARLELPRFGADFTLI